MLWQPALPERYRTITDEALGEAISARRAQLGDQLLILGHHYQQDEVIRHADLTGDSLKLSQMAAVEARKRGTRFIVFCGVHFMAETADIVTDDAVRVILPDLAAGCSMADMAEYDDVVQAWEEIHEAWRDELGAKPMPRLVPITYVNSSAAVKAFVGERGGACCTSSNAQRVFEWAMRGGQQIKARDEDIRVIFLPDQHLGRNTASACGYLTEVEEAAGQGAAQTRVWNPRKPTGGLTPEQLRDAKVLLWAGHCSVHKLFRPEHVEAIREQYRDKGGITVIVHPECAKEVVDKADLRGSTEFIIRAIEQAAPGTNWAVGTEFHLVNRLAADARKRGVNVRILSECQCLCTTMFRIDQPHLLWVLDNLAQGRVVNEITVHPEAKRQARLSLERMLALAEVQALTPALVD